MRLFKLPPLVLAVALQVMPVCRVAYVSSSIAPAAFAIVFRCLAVLGAALGTYDAVSGASAAISGVVQYPYYPTNPITFTAVGKKGVSFAYRIIVTGNNPDTNVDYYGASPLPSGLTINTNLGQPGFILGTPSTAGTFPVTLTAGNMYYDQDGGAPIHTNITIIIAPASGNYSPFFATQPQDTTATNGLPTSLSAAAMGSPAPGYQWRKNGTNISGATGATYTTASATTNDAAVYTVKATNSSGSATSQVATLAVLVPAAITTQPQTKTVLAGTPATFSVAATGLPPPGYQWQMNAADLPGATLSSYTLASVASGNAGDYTVLVSNGANTVTSQVARLNVVQVPSFTNVAGLGDHITFSFSREAGAVYQVLASQSIPSTNWVTLTNFPVLPSSTSVSMTNSMTNSPTRFYQIRMTIP